MGSDLYFVNEESKAAVLTELPDNYDQVEEVHDVEETEQLTRLLSDEQLASTFVATDEDRSVTSEFVDDAMAEQDRI